VITSVDFEAAKLMPGLVMIQPADPPKEVGSLYLADRVDSRQSWGCAVNVGPGVEGVEVGDWVIYERWAASSFEVPDMPDDVTIVLAQNVLAVIEDGKPDSRE
jgi:co-chaperonin GroES (HSP10)